MALSEEQREIALRVANEMRAEPKYTRFANHEEWGQYHTEFSARFLAALPKPEPVAEIIDAVQTPGYFYVKKLGAYIPQGTKLYTESPIAQPASKQKPIAWVTTNEDGDYAMLFFDQQEARRYSGDDEPVGLAPVPSIAPQPEQENYKAQRDALLETLEKAAVAFWKLDNADIHAQEAESAIASVKGGARCVSSIAE